MAHFTNKEGHNARLVSLAGTDENRLAVLAGRRERRKSRWRSVTCPACNETDHDYRAPTEICDQCLIVLWGARDVIAGEFESAGKKGLKPFHIPTRFYWLPYPHLATSNERIPAKATFARKDFSHEASDGTLQILLSELITALSTVLPSDPASVEESEPLFPGGEGGYRDDRINVRLPAVAAKALRDLWHLFRWHSHEAYRQGFEAGHDLLGQMNLGGVTYERFTMEIAEQTKRLQVQQQKAEKGETPR
jgi:hypothetical protein